MEELSLVQPVEIFKNDAFGEIRVVMVDGEPWFVAADVCKVLGLEQVTRAMNRLDEDEKGLLKVTHPQNHSKFMDVNGVNEPGLYHLVLCSTKPEAKPFKRWIAHDVIPAIRKHGGYLTPDTIEKVLSDPDTIIRLATDLKAEKQKRLQAEKQRDILLHVQKTYTSTEIAKEIGMKSAQALNLWLAEKGIQFKQNGTWVLYSKYADLGYTEIKQNVLDNGKIVYDRRWTNYGRDFILKLWEEENHGISDDN